MAKLTIIHVDGTENVHELEEDVITIGRMEDNQIQIEHPSVSGHHAQLTSIGGGYQLRDLNSTNGTRVNGGQVSEHPLREGDRIRFGKVETIYHAGAGSGQAMPLPETGQIRASITSSSARPQDFATASPFRKPTKKKDPAGVAIALFALLAIGFMGFAVATLFSIQPPV